MTKNLAFFAIFSKFFSNFAPKFIYTTFYIIIYED